MRHILSIVLTSFLSWTTCTLQAQFNSDQTFQTFDSIRPADYRFPGSYEVIASLKKNPIYTEDSTELNIFITGYGLIGRTKLDILFSESIFDSQSTLNMRTVTQINATEAQVSDSTVEINSKDNSYIIEIPAFEEVANNKPFIFWFNRKNSSILFSEYATPVKLKLHSKEKIKDGNYTIKIVFSYFDSREWKSSSQIVDFHVNSYFEEHNLTTNFLYAFAALAGILAIAPLIGQSVTFIKRKIRKKPQIEPPIKPTPQPIQKKKHSK